MHGQKHKIKSVKPSANQNTKQNQTKAQTSISQKCQIATATNHHSTNYHTKGSTMPTLHLDFTKQDFGYPIHIAPLREHLHTTLSALKPTKILLITNEMIKSLYLPYLQEALQASTTDTSTRKNFEILTYCIEDGEVHKNMSSIEGILDFAFANKLDRKSLMISLGGGIVSDIVGFASGIYERGISFVSIPTTLLAQVDASVGGKCGINNAYGKNLVGLFHQPKAVFVDTHFLRSLPVRELRAGIAEMIKIAVCFEEKALEDLEGLEVSGDINSLDFLDSLAPHIKKAIELKSAVVQKDEKEAGIRAGLNYGHTFGHAIENLTHYTKFLHGEAVAMGMRMANALALKLGNLSREQVQRIDSVLSKFGLDFDYKIDSIEEFYEKLFLDKKSKGGKITLVLPRGIGGVDIRDDIDRELILETLREFG